MTTTSGDKVSVPTEPSPEGSTAGSSRPESRDQRPVVAGLRKASQRYALIAVWAVMCAVYAITEPDLFPQLTTVQTILSSQQPLVFMAMALLCTISIGEFVDLSVPAVFGLAATVLPVLVVQHGWSLWLAALVAVLAAVVVGACNGVLVVFLRVNTIVVTLGMGTLIGGIALWLSNLNTVSGLPTSFADIALHKIGGLPISFFYGVALVAVIAHVMAFTPLGRHMRFVGASREVSRLSGVRVNRIRFGAFVTAGLINGVGGVIAAAALGGYNPSTSDSYLLPVFAAVFLGTAVIQPGRFNPIGTFIGIYFLETGIFGLQLLGLESWVTPVFYGGVLVVAVTLSTLLNRRTA